MFFTHTFAFQMQKRVPPLLIKLDNLVQAYLMAPHFALLEVLSLIEYTSALSFERFILGGTCGENDFGGNGLVTSK